MAEQDPDSHLSGSGAPALAAWLHTWRRQGNRSGLEISARGRGQEAASLFQAKSPRHRAGLGFPRCSGRPSGAGRGSCVEVRVVGLKLVEMHQFSGEAFNPPHFSKPMETIWECSPQLPLQSLRRLLPGDQVEEGRVQDRAGHPQRELPPPKVVPAGPEPPAPSQPCPVSVRLFTGTQS